MAGKMNRNELICSKYRSSFPKARTIMTSVLYVYAVRAHCTYPSFLPDFLIYDINAVIKSTAFRGKTITEGDNE